MKSLVTLSLVAVSLGACLLAAGCGNTAGADQAAVDALNDQVAKLAKQNSDWEVRVKNLERQLAGTAGDIASIRNRMKDRPAAAAVEAASAEGEGEGTDATAAALSGDAKQIAEFLKTDSGQKALADAITEVNNRQSRERWNRMAEGMVDRFAERANLSSEQSKRMKELTGDMMKKMGDAWATMRNTDLTPEQRTEARAAAMASMGELREQLNEDVKLVLDADQYAMYEEEQARMMRGGFGGGRRRGGGGDR